MNAHVCLEVAALRRCEDTAHLRANEWPLTSVRPDVPREGAVGSRRVVAALHIALVRPLARVRTQVLLEGAAFHGRVVTTL